MPTSSARRPNDLIRLLTRAERLAARRLQAVLDEEGCSLDAWRVLTLLADDAGHHMSAIAEAAFLPPPTLTKLVDQLVDQNLVHRRVDPHDRRRILVHLTPRGRDHWRRVDRAVRRDWPALGEGDEEMLKALLERLAETVDGSTRV
ncbi:MarR family transcriptional regulator [Streptomyces sp. V2]|jgi:DNA-binding MarR family transcriptional regulator|uniref:MarR family winged helix-turn-helix transcriptional regulator n=1 Tax=Streptomyces niveiscabiei TaxID=164115 RepID=A0ABW9I4L0_9ACTN|nr:MULTISPECIES: MarR family transcriptional regulator [Streptomyces]PWG11419.1 MarR family transcriptional regulator [Streptomyces sp. V2]QZZ31933.1 MarR family transcriptional regulator [Streptomyces sp. ST1015]